MCGSVVRQSPYPYLDHTSLQVDIVLLAEISGSLNFLHAMSVAKGCIAHEWVDQPSENDALLLLLLPRHRSLILLLSPRPCTLTYHIRRSSAHVYPRHMFIQ